MKIRTSFIYIYIEREREREREREFKENPFRSIIEVQFCTMYPKLFIFREFYFLILELIGGPHHIYYPSKLLSTKTKEFRINELGKKKGTSQYQKLRIHKKILKNI